MTLARWCRTAPLTLLVAAAPALAQKADFYPALALGTRYTDNVYYALSGVQNDLKKVSDVANRLEIALPLRRESPTRSFEATYEGSFEKYREIEELDNDAHDIGLSFTWNRGPSSHVGLAASYARTQAQGDPSSLDPAEIILSDRTNRDLYSMSVRGGGGLGRRYQWAGSAEASRYEFEAISGAPTPVGPIEDRDRRHAGIGIRRLITRATSVGLGYGYERFVLDVSGTEENHSLDLSVKHELNRDYTVDGEIGAFRRVTTVGGTKQSFGGVDLQGTFGLRRALRRLDILAAAERIPSSGGALEGTSTDTALALTLRGKPLRAWRWGYSTRYALRDPSTAGASTIRAVAAAGSVEWFVLRSMGLEFSADYVTQDGADVPELNGSYAEGELRVVWYPRGIEHLQTRRSR